MRFQPSQHSHGNTGRFGDAGGGSSSSVTYYMLKDTLYALDSVNKTAKRLVVSGMPSTRASSPPYDVVVKLLPQAQKLSESDAYQLIAAANSAAAKAGAALPTGTYSDSSGYTYEISPTSITIYKKSGAKWKTISSSDSDWSTYSANLARDLAAGNLKSGKAAPPATKRVSAAPAPAPAALPPPSMSMDTIPLTERVWFWPAVIGGTIVAGGAIWYLFLQTPEQPAGAPA